MTLSRLNHIAHYNAKLLVRSWLFRLFFLLAFIGILLLQIVLQTNLFAPASGVVTLSSFMPYTNAYWFTILQLFPILFLAGTFLNKDRKLDSMDTIYYRPASNAEYIWGICWGFVRVFFQLAIFSLLCSMLLHLFASLAPFNGWIYLFYLFTLILPAMVFMLGFSFLITSLVKNTSLSMILLLGYLMTTLFYIGDARNGLFDPFGITLPNAFSGITGHPNMVSYLLQRGCWLFIGLGCIGLTVVHFKRLPNHPRKRQRQLLFALAFFSVGLLLGTTTDSLHQRAMTCRAAYTESYNKVEKEAKMTLLSQQISYKQQGDQMAVLSHLTIQNQTRGDVQEVILYLNPALQVNSILSEGAELSYTRENQVIRLQTRLAAGESRDLEISYAGGMDEHLCYLDVPDEVLGNMSSHASGDCRYGKKYASLTTDFTLLIPECLWYPVTVPPVNPNSSYDIPKNFTRYTLEVLHEGDKMVVSQGEREHAGGKTTFRSEHPLHGISLCIGSYEKRALTVDSTTLELYLFKGHEDILDGLKVLQDTLADLFSAEKFGIELKLGRDYPFRRFMVVEVPVTMATYFRNERGGSEFVQPEMVYVPERGVGRWIDFELMKRARQYYSRQGNTPEQLENEQLKSMLGYAIQTLFVQEYGRRQDFSPSHFFFSSFRMMLSGSTDFSSYFMNNVFSISPLFFNYTTSIQFNDCPIIDPVLNLLLGNTVSEGRQAQNMSDPLENNQKVLDYLNQYSLKEALSDPQLEPNLLYEMLKLKSTDLSNLVAVNNFSPDILKAFVKDYTKKHAFRQMDFAHFNEAFMEQHGVNWMDVLPGWFTHNRLPKYRVKDLFMKTVGDGQQRGQHSSESAAQISFSVYNDSEVDGVVSLSYTSYFRRQEGSGSSPRADAMRTQIGGAENVTMNYLVKAHSGIEASIPLDRPPMFLALNTNLSRNLPTRFDVLNTGFPVYTLDTASYVRQVGEERFLDDPGEIIVDNEDDGFRIDIPASRFKLREWFRSNQAQESKYDGIGNYRSSWFYRVNDRAYGRYIYSVVIKLAGKGNSNIEWNARLEREGTYEVFVYTSPAFANFGKMFGYPSSTVGGVTPVWNQHYTVSNHGGDDEVVLDVFMKTGWISLGKFYYTPGVYKVSLSDKGEGSQVIMGDAVKWVYLE